MDKDYHHHYLYLLVKLSNSIAKNDANISWS